jgi:hypothetical protein
MLLDGFSIRPGRVAAVCHHSRDFFALSIDPEKSLDPFAACSPFDGRLPSIAERETAG